MDPLVGNSLIETRRKRARKNTRKESVNCLQMAPNPLTNDHDEQINAVHENDSHQINLDVPTTPCKPQRNLNPYYCNKCTATFTKVSSLDGHFLRLHTSRKKRAHHINGCFKRKETEDSDNIQSFPDDVLIPNIIPEESGNVEHTTKQ